MLRSLLFSALALAGTFLSAQYHSYIPALNDLSHSQAEYCNPTFVLDEWQGPGEPTAVSQESYDQAFDAQGRLTSQLITNSATGDPTRRYTFVHDSLTSGDRCIYTENPDGNGGLRFTSYRYQVIDAKGDMIQEDDYDYDATSQTFTVNNTNRYVFDYDTQGRLIEYLHTTGSGYNVDKTQWTFDTQGRLESRTMSTWENGHWVGASQDQYSYTMNGNVEEAAIEKLVFDAGSGTYVPGNYRQFIWTDPTNDSWLSRNEIRTTQGWALFHAIEREFLPNGKIAVQKFYGNTNSGETMLGNDEYSYTYDATGCLIKEEKLLLLTWNGTAKSTLTYQNQSAVDRPEAVVNAAISLFPNPAGDQINVRLNIAKEAPLTITELYDLNGRKLQTQHWAGQQMTLPIDLKELPAGTYILRVRRGEEYFQKRITRI